ncbi:MAG TPA: PAS domain-containing protein, partial [Buttiauxella sp.]|uniref:PAS domain-containing protein n=1 Tax=Buttiauxella sp. TaxID=1972222 RepID=UPI002B48C286
MNFSFARVWSLIGSLCSGLATKRWLLLALFIQGVGFIGYLYLERNWIEDGVVHSLKNVSSMHRRSFEQLDTTIRYQLLAVGEAMLVNRNPDHSRLNDNTLLKSEISSSWLDAIVVLDPTGKIVASHSDLPLASILPANVLATHTFQNVPQYRAIHDDISASFFVSRPQAPELGGGGLAIYRRLTSPDGSMLGSVIGFTSQHSLSTLLDTDAERGFNLGKNGILTIIDGRTHEIFYRYSYDEGSVKMNNVLSQGGGKVSLLDTRYGPNVKSFRSPIDGVERLAVLQPLHQSQWLQVVGASKNEYLFKWRLEVAFSVLLFVCLAVLQWLLMRFFQRYRQQNTLLNLVLDSVDACVYFKTNDRRFAYVNANTAALYDLPVEQVIGRLDSDMLPQKIADDFWVNDSKVLTSGIKHNFTEVAVNAQGETRYYSSVKVPAQLPGQLPALVGISTDVTELHEQ